MWQDIVSDGVAEIEHVGDLLFSGHFADVVAKLGEGDDVRHDDFLSVLNKRLIVTHENGEVREAAQVFLASSAIGRLNNSANWR